MTVSWTFGTGSDTRTYRLRMDFPYAVTNTRTAAPFVSDPGYVLQCTYNRDQPELVPFTSPPHLTFTNRESVGLVQLDPANYPPRPELSWAEKKYQAANTNATVDLHFLEGLPLYQGRPPEIYKTLLLDRWLSPSTIKLPQVPTFSTDSYFARTLLPGHHNFWESVLIQAELDPTLPEAARKGLREANIRYIWTWKDLFAPDPGSSTDRILLLGFDNSIR